jgi:hypothetical protein
MTKDTPTTPVPDTGEAWKKPGDQSRTEKLPAGAGGDWPDGPTETVRPTGDPSSVPAPRRSPEDDLDADEDRERRRSKGNLLTRRVSKWGKRGFWLASVAGVIVILLLLTTLLGRWPHIGNPFTTKTTDRSQPALLLSIQNMARFEAASGNFQVIVDIQQDKKYIPDIIFSQRSLFVAAGSVAAYVDFTNLGKNDVVTSPDRKTATIDLPAPQLDKPTLDLSRSYVYSEQSGIINKMGSLFGGDTNKEQELYLYAQQKIASAAVDSQLSQRAADNTRTMLNELLHSLGFTTVTINFAAS